MELSMVVTGIKTIPSTTTIEECMLLYSYVKQLPLNAIIVELGTGLGRSTAAMAYACNGTGRKIYTIDNYCQGKKFTQEVAGDWSASKAKENLKRLHLEQYITFLNYETTDTQVLHFIPTPFDFIFIDAGHSYQGVIDDILLWKQYLRPNGIMCGHDWSFAYPEGIMVIKAVSSTILDPSHPFEVQHRIWKLARYW